MNGPLVSVCIGSYNRERYLWETLESVFAQTYRPIEVIVVDDASTDGTVEIARSFGSRVLLEVRAVNSGLPAVTRNAAIRRAQGELVAFLDSDDIWYPRKLERQVELLRREPTFVLCHTYMHRIDASSRVLGIRHEGRLPPSGDYADALFQHCVVSTSSAMVRRSSFDDIGFFNEAPARCAAEDHEWFLRLALDHPFGLVDDVLGGYRDAPTGISHQSLRWKRSPLDVSVQRDLAAGRAGWTHPRILPRRLNDVVADADVVNARYWREQRRAARSLWFCADGLRRAPFHPGLWSQAVRTMGRLLWPA